MVYNKNFESGDLSAKWFFENNNKKIKGTGKATGQAGSNFAGKYYITYYTNENQYAVSFDLIIEEDNGFYTLRWYKDNELKYTGTGMLHNNSLIAGWKNYLTHH